MTHFIEKLQENANAFPNATAVKAKIPSDSLSYFEFNQRINQYANYLRQHYQADGQPFRIAIVYERSLEMILLMLAAWKINASFILIDADNLNKPGSVKHKLERVKPKLIATAREQVKHDELAGYPQYLCLNDAVTQNEIDSCSCEFTFIPHLYNTEAYIIATSGSTTGEPKLVVIEHSVLADSGLEAVFDDLSKLMSLGINDTVLLDGAINWDPIICMIGVGLYRGSALYIATVQEKMDRQQLLQDCVTHQVNVMLVVPSAVHEIEPLLELLEQIANLRMLFTGEELTPKIVNTFKRVATGGIVNGYGPCEGPIGITATLIKHAHEISIHRPMKGREYAIISVEEPYSEVESGELIWHADGFAGYLKNPQETQGKMLEWKGKQYWHSRDKVSFKDGILTYLGRIDKQFKVRGVLVNPISIDIDLRQTFAITAHTMAIQSEYTGSLIPVVFYKQNEKAPVYEAKMKKKLHYTPLVKLVCLESNEHYLTGNEKTDEIALRNKYLQMKALTPKPKTLTEFLHNVWCEILDVPSAHVDDNFEHLGGTSLMFKELQCAALGSEFLRGGFDSSEERSFRENPTFGHLLELAQKHDRSKLLTWLYQERVDAPLILIDPDRTQDYSQIMPESPLILVRTTNPQESASARSIDAKKTLQRMGIAEPYYMAMVLGQDAFSLRRGRNVLGYMEDILYPRAAYDWKICNLRELQYYVEREMDINIKHDIRKAYQICSDNVVLNRKMIFDDATDTMIFIAHSAERLKYIREFLGEVIDSDDQIILLDVADADPINLADLFKKLRLHPQHMKRIASMCQENIALVINNITKPEQAQQLAEQLLAWGLGGCRFILLCNPGHYQEHQFTQYYPDIRVHRPVFENDQPINNIPPRIMNPNYGAIATIYNADSDQNPLFLFAPITGEEVYRPLSEHRSLRMISLRHPLLADSSSDLPTSFKSLNELTQFYADVVEHYQPEGAIALCGWSFGGLVAAGVAEQLRQRGRTLYYVGIVDTTHPSVLTKMLGDVDAHRQLLYSRLRWLLTTYSITASNDFFEQADCLLLCNLTDADRIWEALLRYVNKKREVVNLAHICSIIKICRQHYQFSFSDIVLPTDLHNFTLFEAKKLIPDEFEPIQFSFTSIVAVQLKWQQSFFQQRGKSTLGWPNEIKRIFIFDTDHFTIHLSPILADIIRKKISDAAVIAHVDLPLLNNR